MHPTQIDVTDAGRTLSIRWQDNSLSTIPAGTLRDRCECVECRSRNRGAGFSLIPVATEASRTIREVHLVSSSKLLVVWEDGHNKSYYTFRTLRETFPPVPLNSTE